MGTGIRVDAVGIAEAATSVNDSSDDVAANLERLRAGLDAVGDASGGDEVGGAFGQACAHTTRYAMASISTYVTQLGYAAHNLATAATAFATAEVDNTALLAAWRIGAKERP